MKKLLCFFTILISFLSFSLYVNAARGDLIYNIDSVTINDSKINIKGYAFIHRTQNYVTIYKRLEQKTNNEDYNSIVKSGGGQTTYILVTNCSNYHDEPAGCKVIEKTFSEDPYEAEKKGIKVKNYNFYKQQYNGDDKGFNVTRYNNYSDQQCDSGDLDQCYYEDIGFNIDFEVNDLMQISSGGSLYFYIASSNNDYGKTGYRPLAISSISGSSSYIDVTETQINGVVNFIAGKAHWRLSTVDDRYRDGFYGCTRPSKTDPSFGDQSWCYTSGEFYANFDIRVANSVYHILRPESGNQLLSVSTNDGAYYTNFLNGTSSPGFYSFCVYTSGSKKRQDACVSTENGFCTKCASGSQVLRAYSSWVEINGTNQLTIKVKNPYLCEVNDPDKDSGVLECNQGKTYNSTCEELTVSTDMGSARVKIEQNGNVTSVLTPDSIYAGGGFSLGIMYYNTIKWSYVSGQNINNELHSAVTNAMNRKIKDYESFVAGINISNMQMGGKAFNLTKQCTTSNRNKDYYNKELIVSCVFTIPKSDIDLIGNVSYDYNSGININNKYYTPLNYEGKYKITADITGMDRITESASVSDSKENGRRWTGNWSDTFTNCEIDVYGLLMKNNSYNFIYRPIDIFNPFPNRNAGINWFDWYKITRNKERLENTYSNSSQYKSILDNKAINDIKNYNNSYDYLGWDSIDKDTYESSFITDNDYIVRGGH